MPVNYPTSHMKYAAIPTILLFLSAQIFTFQTITAEIPVKITVKKVGLYASGAHIVSEAEVILQKGIQELRLEGISPFADENSLIFKCSAGFSLMSVQLERRPPEGPVRNAEYRTVEDSMRLVSARLSRVQNQVTGLQQEFSMIRANQKLAPAGMSLVSELEKAATFFRTRVEDILNRQYELEQQKRKFQDRLNALQQKLQEMQQDQPSGAATALVVINASQAGKASVQLTYSCGNAGWLPFYDIKASGNSEKVGFIARASVWQNTGISWKDVMLCLNTGNPEMQQSIPSISPWYLSLNTPLPKIRSRNNNKAFEAAPPSMAAGTKAESSELDFQPSSSPVAINTEAGTQNVFELNGVYSLRSDGKALSVEIQKFEIPARFQYLCRPRQEKAAFLEAKLSDWGKSGLLPGEAGIFLDDNFVGKTYFETQLASDTLSLSFGRDQNISVEKKQIKYLHGKNLLGSEKTLEVAYELLIKNRKSIASDLVIEEQIPLSPNTEAEVELLESSGADFQKETGVLRWTARMKAGESQALRFRFRIKYPKNRMLEGSF